MHMVVMFIAPAQRLFLVSKIIYPAFWISLVIFCTNISNSVCPKLSSFFSTQTKPDLPIVCSVLVGYTALYTVTATGQLTVIFDPALSFFANS